MKNRIILYRYLKTVVLFIPISLFACSTEQNPQHLFEQGNYKQSYSLYLALAEQGDLEAQNYIGIHHYLGLGTARDYRKAKTWFEKSASGKYADAQYNLGSMYENGEYFKEDYMTAYMWLYAAHRNGNTHAAKRMWGITEDHKLFGNQVARAEKLAEVYINNKSDKP